MEEEADINNGLPMYCLLGLDTDEIVMTEELSPDMATVPISKKITEV